MIWGAGVYLADNRDEAIRKLEPAHDERFKWFAPFGFVRYADEQGRTWGTPGAPSRTPSLKDGVRLIQVAVPSGAVAGTYSAIITHSVY